MRIPRALSITAVVLGGCLSGTIDIPVGTHDGTSALVDLSGAVVDGSQAIENDLGLPLFCGDLVCSSNESCHNCPTDCGACPVPDGATLLADLTMSSSIDQAMAGRFDLAMPTHDLSSPPRDLFSTSAHDLAVSSVYPPAPYGNMVGQTLPNFALQGYYSPGVVQPTLATAAGWSSFDFDKIRKSGNRYLLIYGSSFT